MKPSKIFKHVILIFLLVVMLYPIFMVISNSFKTDAELYNNILGFPSDPTMQNYSIAITDGNMLSAFVNSLMITFAAVALVTVLGTFAAFALTRSKFRLRKPFYSMFIVGITVPYQVCLFQLYRVVDTMDLTNNLFGLILVYAAWGLPLTVFIMYGFFSTIPREIEEAAIIDGCSVFKLYSKIVIPLSVTVISATVILNLVNIWNDMLFPLIFIHSQGLKPVSLALLSFQGQFISRYTVMFAGAVLASAPLMAVYLILQKNFIAGMMMGSVKG
jgi:raffinose/stachyose/melibiose transport system permease protein